jgi:glycosidase
MKICEIQWAFASGRASRGRDGCRTPMVWEADAPNAGFSTGKPWLPVSVKAAARAVYGQENDPESVLKYYRQILRLRHQQPALLHGMIAFLPAPDGVLAFVRQLVDQKNTVPVQFFRRKRRVLGRSRSGSRSGHNISSRGRKSFWKCRQACAIRQFCCFDQIAAAGAG